MIEPLREPVHPLPPLPPADRAPSSGSVRNRVKWLLAVLLTLTAFALFCSLSLAQIMSRGTGERMLRRSVASLTEIDSYVDRRYDDFHQQATTPSGQGPVVLADFPVHIEFDRAEAAAMSPQDLRQALLDRSASLIYDHGMSVFGQGQADTSEFSPPGAVRRGLDLIRERNERILRVLTFSLALASGILAFGLVLTGRGFGRLASVGAAVSVAAILFLAGAVALRYTLRQLADGQDEFLSEDLLRIGADAAWAAIRDGIAFTVLGAAFVCGGFSLSRWSDARTAGRRQEPSTL